MLNTPRFIQLQVVSACLALSGLSGGSANQPTLEAKIPSPTPKVKTPKTTTLKTKLLQTYRSQGKVWRNYLIPKSTTEAQLIALAREYHRDFPKDNARFFDDDRLFGDFVYNDKHDLDSKVRFPVEWVNQHYLGMVNRMRQIDKNGNKSNVFKWQLSQAYGEKIAFLE